jgi:predicted RNA-binding protein YlqC (UPF0109 family)
MPTLYFLKVPARTRRRTMKELLEAIAKALVDNPDQVQVRVIEGEQVTVLELRVHASDVGKLIGRQGRMVKSIRTILAAAGMKIRKRVTLEILSEPTPENSR